jgi:hypothetical protein
MIALIRYWREGIMGLLLIALGISIIALNVEKRHSGKLQAQIVTLSAKLESISTAKDEQRQTTERTIKGAQDGLAHAKVITRIIHDAPLPADCGTPALETAKGVL